MLGMLKPSSLKVGNIEAPGVGTCGEGTYVPIPRGEGSMEVSPRKFSDFLSLNGVFWEF